LIGHPQAALEAATHSLQTERLVNDMPNARKQIKADSTSTDPYQPKVPLDEEKNNYSYDRDKYRY
jgi:hypothetical protein